MMMMTLVYIYQISQIYIYTYIYNKVSFIGTFVGKSGHWNFKIKGLTFIYI